MSIALPASWLCLRANTAGAGTACTPVRRLRTASPLEFKPQSCPSGARARLRCRRPPVWCYAGQHFSKEPVPARARAVCSPETTSYLRNLCNGSEIYLVGTVHISKASADEVRQIIRLVQPDVVLVELDEERAASLQDEQSVSMLGFLMSTLPGVLLPSKQWAGNVIELFLGGMYLVLHMLGMEPGGEFKAALEEAEAVGARVVCGDRPIDITTSRIASSFSVMDLNRKSTAPDPAPAADKSPPDSSAGSGEAVADHTEAIKKRRVVTAMLKDLRRHSPQLATALYDERDDYMVEQLRVLTGTVVAVVGLAHLDGIEDRWQQLEP